MSKKEITIFSKFYPKTLRAMGGPKGLQKWLNGGGAMPTQAARIFQAENDLLCTVAEEFEESTDTELLGVIASAAYAV